MTGAMHLAVRAVVLATALAAVGYRYLGPQQAEVLRASFVLKAPIPLRDPKIAHLPPLFTGTAALDAAAAPADLPELLGIAGRLPDDGEALVRLASGKTQSLRVGDSVAGRKVVSIEVDRIMLERDGLRQAVALKRQ